MTGAEPARALIVDVDGVVAPLGRGISGWGDDVIAGDVFGPVVVSPGLCSRLDKLNQLPEVLCCWLTSWDNEMRTTMQPFPGRDWLVIAEPSDVPDRDHRWWKLTAVEGWLDQNPQVRTVAWCDDHLLGRQATVRRRLVARGVRSLLIAPDPAVGLIPAQIARIEAWAARPCDPNRRDVDTGDVRQPGAPGTAE